MGPAVPGRVYVTHMRASRVGVISVVFAVACGGAGSGLIGTIGGPNSGGGNPSTAAVQVVNFAFQPSLVTIRPGGSVTWTWNSDTTSHNIAFTDNVQNAGTRKTGTHTRTFTAPGTFTYRCTLHSGETGQVTVQ